MDMPYIFIHVKDEQNEQYHEYLGGLRHYAYRFDFYVCTDFIDPHLSENDINDIQVKALDFADKMQREISKMFHGPMFMGLRKEFDFTDHYIKTSFKQLNAFDDNLNNKEGYVHCHVIEFGMDGLGNDPMVAGAGGMEEFEVEVFMGNEKIGEVSWKKGQ
jgi:hypothetical protein